MTSSAIVTSVLAQAATRLLGTLIRRAQDCGDETDDATYIILEHWARSVMDAEQIQAVLNAAQIEFAQIATAHQSWLDLLADLLNSAYPDGGPFAEDLWRANLFRLESAAEALWNQYPELQRRTVVKTGRHLPSSWGHWIFPMQAFMGTVETLLLQANPTWDDLLSSEVALSLLEEAVPEAEKTAASTDVPFSTDEQFNIAAALDAYLRACHTHIAHIDPRGYPRSVNRTVPLADVYIPLRLQPLDAREMRSLYVRYRTATYLQPDQSDSVANRTPPSVAVQEVLSHHQMVLILGKSGAGKSTLLRFIVAERIRLLLDPEVGGVQVETRPGGTTSARLVQPLPIYVDLADYVEGRHVEESLHDFTLRRAVELARDPAVGMVLAEALEQGQCLLLLDGLDQTTTDEQRRMLAVSVSEAAARWRASGNQVVVTSRYEGYEATPLAEDFHIFVIRGLERGQIGPFALRWSLIFARMHRPLLSDEEAMRRAEAEILPLVREVAAHHRLYSLANTPLVLRMLVGVYHPGMLLTPQRAAIYQMVADALIREWHLPHSAADRPAILEQEATELLSELAFWLQSSRPTGMLTEQELRDILAHAWSELHPEIPSAQVSEAVDDFVHHLRGSNGVLAELAPQRYGFIYHALQEYFAARHLVASYRLAPSRIRTYLHDPHWDEVIQLAVSFMSLRSRDDASDLIEVGILARGPRAEQCECTPSPFENLLKRDLFFAARLLGSGVEAGPEVTCYIAKELMHLWLDGDRDSLGRFSLMFDRARQCLVGLDGTSGSWYALQIAREGLNSQDEHVQSHAAEAVTFWPSHYAEACQALIEHGRGSAPLLKRAIAGSLGRVGSLTLSAYRVLLNLVSDPDDEVSRLAQQALEATAPVPLEALSMWIDFLRSGNSTRRRVSLRVLAHMGSLPPVVINELLHLLGDPDPDTRQAAVDVLANVTVLSESALMAICRAAQDVHAGTDIRIAAINALRRPVELPNEVLELLTDWTYDPDVNVRRSAALALGTCLNSSLTVIDALVERLDDPVDSVRAAVVEPLTLKGGTHPRVQHVLAHMVSDPIHTVRCAVARALRHFPRPGDELRAALRVLLNDGEMIVREATLDTIAHLEDPGAEIINYLTDLATDPHCGIGPKSVQALASLRGLPETALLALAKALPVHWQTCGREIAACLAAHVPLSQHVIQEVMDLAVLSRRVGMSSTRVPMGLRALALEILGNFINEVPTAVRILLDAAGEAGEVQVQVAGLRGLGHARHIMPGVEQELLRLMGQGPLEVRCAAGIALGNLVRNLPDPPFRGDQLTKLGEALAALLQEVAPRAAWESETRMQNELLLALDWVVARARPYVPRLPARLENLTG